MSFSEQTPPIKGAAQEQAREASIKARELPVTNRGAFTTSIEIDVPPTRREWEYESQQEALIRLTSWDLTCGGGSAMAGASDGAFLTGVVDDAGATGDDPPADELAPGLDRDIEAEIAGGWTSPDDQIVLGDASIAGFDDGGAAAAGAGSCDPMIEVIYDHDDNLNVIWEERRYSLPTTKEHGYDGLDRLSLTRGALVNESYQYSRGGSITRAAMLDYIGGSGSTSPQAVVQVKQGTTTVRSLQYDPDGFVTIDNSTRHWADGLGCDVLTEQGTTRVTRICDDDGHELFRKTIVGSSTQRVIDLFGLAEYRPDAFRLVLRTKVGGTTIAEETYYRGFRLGSESRVIHNDMRGSVLLTSVNDAPPTISQSIEYDAWGASVAGTSLPLHRFVDHEQDALGLYTFGKRAYSPTLRRWLSPDPLVLANPDIDRDLRQLNLYCYAANNPVAVIDRNGTFGLLGLIPLGVALGAVAISTESDSVVVDSQGVARGGSDLTAVAPDPRPIIEGVKEFVEKPSAGTAASMAGGLVASFLLKGKLDDFAKTLASEGADAIKSIRRADDALSNLTAETKFAKEAAEKAAKAQKKIDTVSENASGADSGGHRLRSQTSGDQADAHLEHWKEDAKRKAAAEAQARKASREAKQRGEDPDDE